MPIYDFLCPICKQSQEQFYSIADKPNTVPCKCGGLATKQLSIGGIQCDELPCWAKHPEVLGCLQPKGERRLETRTEMKKYMKAKNIVEI